MKVGLYYKQYFYRAMNTWLHDFCGEWEGWVLVNWFNHTSWVTAVTPTDRPKSVRNSCVIKVFCGVFMLSRCFLDYSVGVGVFVTGLSQISSFFSISGSVNSCGGKSNALFLVLRRILPTWIISIFSYDQACKESNCFISSCAVLFVHYNNSHIWLSSCL